MKNRNELIGLLIFVVIFVIFIIIIVWLMNSVITVCVDEIDCALRSKQVLAVPSEGSALDRLIPALDGLDEGYNFGSEFSSSGRYYFVASSRYGLGVLNSELGSVYVYYRESDGTLTHHQTITEQDVKVSPGFVSPGGFGESVSAYGNYLAVSAPAFADINGSGDSDSGAVYIFERVNGDYVLIQRIANNDSSLGTLFGHKIILQGIHLLIFRDGVNNNVAEYYTYDSVDNHFKHTQSIVDTSAAPSAFEIAAVSLDQNTGRFAYSRVLEEADDGQVHTFMLNAGSWSGEQIISAPTAALGEGFGFSLSMEGDYLAIGQGGSLTLGGGTGNVEVYVHDGTSWVQEQTLSDARPDHGASVFVLDDVLFVGVPDSTDPNLYGSVMVYKRNDLGSYVFIEEKQHDSSYVGGYNGYTLYADDHLVFSSSSVDNSYYSSLGLLSESAYVFELDRTFVQVAC